MQRHDVASTLIRRCFKVVYLLGGTGPDQTLKVTRAFIILVPFSLITIFLSKFQGYRGSGSGHGFCFKTHLYTHYWLLPRIRSRCWSGTASRGDPNSAWQNPWRQYLHCRACSFINATFFLVKWLTRLENAADDNCRYRLNCQ